MRPHLLATALAARQQASSTIDVQTAAPSSALQMSPWLASFSIEEANWPDWAGNAVGQPNAYANQLFTNLAQRTGQGVYLRVGADTEDHAYLNLSMPVGSQGPSQESAYIGRDWYRLSGNLPSGTHFMWGINLKEDNLTETNAQAALLAEAFQGSNPVSGVTLDQLEIGNEPDFFGWSIGTWVSRWQQFAESCSGVLAMGTRSGTFFIPGAFYGDGYNNGFNPATALGNNNLLRNNGTIQAWTNAFSEHAYVSGYSSSNHYYAGELMNKTAVRNFVAARSSDRNTVVTYPNRHLQYVLGETNSYSSHGVPGLSNTVEAAIWATDYLLQLATHNVARAHFHHGIGYRYNTFQPVSNAGDDTNITPPHILPSYHAFLIVNEAIGTSGTNYVAELSASSNTIASYGIYNNNKLVQIVIINSQPWTSGAQPFQTVQLSGWTSGMSGSAKRMKGGYSNTFSGVTWAGQNFETSSGAPSGSVITESVTSGSISIGASQILAITIN